MRCRSAQIVKQSKQRSTAACHAMHCGSAAAQASRPTQHALCDRQSPTAAVTAQRPSPLAPLGYRTLCVPCVISHPAWYPRVRYSGVPFLVVEFCLLPRRMSPQCNTIAGLCHSDVKHSPLRVAACCRLHAAPCMHAAPCLAARPHGWVLGRSYWRFLYTTLTSNGASADGTAESDREAELRVVTVPPSSDIIYVLRFMLYFMFHSCGTCFLQILHAACCAFKTRLLGRCASLSSILCTADA